MRGVLSTLLAALLVTAAAHAGEVDPEAYRLQPGDVVSISVWNEKDMQSDVLVRPDGGISFQLVGDLAAAERTVDELRKAIEERLVKYVPDVAVTVAIRQIGGNRIYVVGKVARPGEFPFIRPLDVMQSLAMAGGVTPFADVNDISILRWENGKQVVLRFRYKEVASGRKLEQNIVLRSGDTVVVP